MSLGAKLFWGLAVLMSASIVLAAYREGYTFVQALLWGAVNMAFAAQIRVLHHVMMDLYGLPH